LWEDSKENEEIESFDIEIYTVREKKGVLCLKFGLVVGMFLRSQ